MAQLSGNIGCPHWCYDEYSGYLEPDKEIVFPIVGTGHYVVGDYHTELLGVPSLYLENAKELSKAAASLSDLLRPYAPDTIVGIAIGGLPLATLCAQMLNLPLAVVEFNDHKSGTIRTRGAQLGCRCAIVDSTFHSGATIKRVLDVTQETCGHSVLAVATRSIALNACSNHHIDIPVHALYHFPVHSWKPDECPYCQNNIPFDERPAMRKIGGTI